MDADGRRVSRFTPVGQSTAGRDPGASAIIAKAYEVAKANRTRALELLIEFSATCFSVRISLLGSTGSFLGTVNSHLGIERHPDRFS